MPLVHVPTWHAQLPFCRDIKPLAKVLDVLQIEQKVKVWRPCTCGQLKSGALCCNSIGTGWVHRSCYLVQPSQVTGYRVKMTSLFCLHLHSLLVNCAILCRKFMHIAHLQAVNIYQPLCLSGGTAARSATEPSVRCSPRTAPSGVNDAQLLVDFSATPAHGPGS